MFCSKCGNELKLEEQFCGKCGSKTEEKEQILEKDRKCKLCKKNIEEKIYQKYDGHCKNCYENKDKKPNKWLVIIKVVLYIVAIIVIIMTFDGADTIGIASSQMQNLRSVSGESIAEAYYQYYGTFLSGLETVIRALGITLGVVIAYIAKKIKVKEDI